MTDPSFVIVLPAIDPQLADDCLTSMAPELLERVFLVDNTDTREISRTWAPQVMFASATAKNRGVPVSWNDGIALARAMHTDYLILCSQSLKFGPPGGVDFIDQLNTRRPPVMQHGTAGWHFLAVNMTVFDVVGVFDPVFTPAFFEDTDFLYRMGLADLPSPRENGRELDQVHYDAGSQGQSLTVTRKLVKIDYQAQAAKYRAKWLGDQGHEQTRFPYADETLDWTYVGPPPNRVKERA